MPSPIISSHFMRHLIMWVLICGKSGNPYTFWISFCFSNGNSRSPMCRDILDLCNVLHGAIYRLSGLLVSPTVTEECFFAVCDCSEAHFASNSLCFVGHEQSVFWHSIIIVFCRPGTKCLLTQYFYWFCLSGPFFLTQFLQDVLLFTKGAST